MLRMPVAEPPRVPGLRVAPALMLTGLGSVPTPASVPFVMLATAVEALTPSTSRVPLLTVVVPL